MFNKTYVHFIILAAALFAVYSNAFNSPFQYDDKHVILWNKDIKTPDGINKMIKSSYRPVLRSTFALNYKWFGLNTAGYHVFNKAIHLINGLLLYLLLFLLFKDRALAFLGSMVFIVHPLNTQAVNYISARSSSLCTVFYILAVIFFISANREKIKNAYMFYTLSFLSFLVALGVKEEAISIPVMLAVYDLLFNKPGFNKFIKKQAVYIVSASGYLLMRLIGTGTIGDYSTERNLATTVFTNLKAMVFENLKLIFVPVNLNIAYEFPEIKAIDLNVIPAIAVIAVLIVVALKAAGSRKWITFAIMWFFVTLLPTQTVVAREEIICEHRLYLAGVSFCIFYAGFVNNLKVSGFKVLPVKTSRVLINLSVLVLILIFGFRTYERNRDWQSEICIWEKMAEKFPSSYKAHSNLGNACAEKGIYSKAIEHYEIILKNSPGDSRVNNNLGNVYYLTGQYDKAAERYRESIKSDPDYNTAYNNLGMVYEKMNLYDSALKVYEELLKVNPDDSGAYSRMGDVYMKKGAYNEAIKMYASSIKIDPDKAVVNNNLGNAYYHKGMYDEAINSYRKALSIEPSLMQAGENLKLAVKMKNLKP